MASFRLHSGDSEFNNRVDALFDSLQTVAVDLKTAHDAKTPQGSKRPHEDDYDDDDGGKDKFCKPQGMPPWRGGMGGGQSQQQGSYRKFGPRNSTPDYIKNPHNWTKYNMKDTKVLSNRENKQEGMKLFHDLKLRRMQEENMTQDEVIDRVEHDKIIFKKPTTKSTPEGSEEMTDVSEKPNTSVDALFGGTEKFRLQEYEVGKSKSKQKSKKPNEEKRNVGKNVASKEVKLGYLMFEEEEEEQDE